MKIEIEDKDLEELILTGENSKYRQLARDSKFMEALARAYRLLEVVEKASGLEIKALTLNRDHYGNEK